MIHGAILLRMVSMEELFSFRTYEIPVDLLRMTGGGPETFEVISDGHIYILKNVVGIEPDHTILEIGCGIGRDAIPLTGIISPNGRYMGIDIIKGSIDWCSSDITPRNPNFTFVHFDIKDQLHNPLGTKKITDFTIPLPDGSVDRIIL
jgi:SAM-dependent methyltransferase